MPEFVLIGSTADIAGDDFRSVKDLYDAASVVRGVRRLVWDYRDVFVSVTDYHDDPALTPADFTNVGAIESRVGAASQRFCRRTRSGRLDFTLRRRRISRISFVHPWRDIGAHRAPDPRAGKSSFDTGAGNQPTSSRTDAKSHPTEGMFPGTCDQSDRCRTFTPPIPPSARQHRSPTTTRQFPLVQWRLGSYLFTTLRRRAANIVLRTYFVVDSECGIYPTSADACLVSGAATSDTARNGRTDVTCMTNRKMTMERCVRRGVSRFVSGPSHSPSVPNLPAAVTKTIPVDFGVLPTTDLRRQATLSGPRQRDSLAYGGASRHGELNLGAPKRLDVSV